MENFCVIIIIIIIASEANAVVTIKLKLIIDESNRQITATTYYQIWVNIFFLPMIKSMV